ncbi:MAG: acyl carrier protein [Desulfobacterales bacterium]|nr:acyl carrier protein [Desulfobacterales bacterium]
MNRTDNLLADGMVDSLGMLRLVTYIENLLDIKIPHSDLVIDNFRNIEVISQYLLQRKSA